MVNLKKTRVKKKPIYLTHDGFLIVDGKEYVESISRNKKIDGIEHLDKQLFKEFDRKGFEMKRNLIFEKIKDTVDKDEILKELIKKIPLGEINNLYKVLKTGKKKKITKQKGCLGLKIGSGKAKTGGAYVQLID